MTTRPCSTATVAVFVIEGVPVYAPQLPGSLREQVRQEICRTRAQAAGVDLVRRVVLIEDQRVAYRLTLLRAAVREVWVAELVQVTEALLPPGLTAREREVFVLQAQRHSRREIAELLGIALSTVKRHLEEIRRKERESPAPEPERAAEQGRVPASAPDSTQPARSPAPSPAPGSWPVRARALALASELVVASYDDLAREGTDLTEREYEVALLASTGESEAAIGTFLGLHPTTVRRRLTGVYRKLRIRGRAALHARLMARSRVRRERGRARRSASATRSVGAAVLQ